MHSLVRALLVQLRRLRHRLLTLVVSLAFMLAPVLPSSAAASPERRAEQVPDRYIVVYQPSVADTATKTDILELSGGFTADKRYEHALQGFAGTLSGDQVEALRADPEVAFVSPDRPVEANGIVALASNDTAPNGVQRIEAATATTTRQASSANVAVVDTGIDLDHPDLNAVDGVNCVEPGGAADDDHGHGTHVAGTVAALNNGSGVIGVAPGTRLFAAKVLDAAGNGFQSHIICAIDWAMGTRTDSDPSNDISLTNMSLSGVGTPVGSCSSAIDALIDPLHRAICNSTAAGITHVVAAGNSGWDFDNWLTPDVPAAYPEVLTVSAVADSDGRPGATGGVPSCDTGQKDDTFATFSNYAATSAGGAHLVAGPGSCILSTWPGGSYATASGTSMAAPHVAGVVALCMSSGGAPGPCSGLRPAQVIDKVRAEAAARSASGGYGFAGDPFRPVSGRAYGHLAWAISGARYNPLTPSRILDTRFGNGAPTALVGAGASLDLQVTGRGGVPSSGVSAVVLNVTVTEPSGAGHLNVFPTGESRPLTSNLNFVAGQTVPNLVVAKVGTGGKVSVYNGGGAAHVIADVAGWYDTGGATSGARYNPLTPSRILDTRFGNGAPTALVGAGASLDLQVTGRGGVPSSGVSAVVLNVTVTDPSAPSYLTAFPTGEARPLASNLNFTAGQTVPNLVVVKVGTGGKVSLFNSAGGVNLIADVAGWYDTGGATSGARYNPLTPARILDTRSGKGAPAAALGQASTLDLQVTGRGGVPSSGVSAVVLNVTVTGPTAGGFLTAFPAGEVRPLASNLNFTTGQTVPNLVVAKVGTGGKVSVYNGGGAAHVIADVAGWYDG